MATTTETFTIHIWEDGVWCWADELQGMLDGRSDSYITAQVKDEWEAEMLAANVCG